MKHIVALLFFCLMSIMASAQVEDPRAAYEAFRKQAVQEYEDFCSKANAEYAEFVRNAWQPFDAQPEIPCPDDDQVPPVIIEDDKHLPPPEPSPEPLPFIEVITIEQPSPQPQPIEPIEESPVVPIDDDIPQNAVAFSFFGTPAEVRVDKQNLFTLNSVDEDAIADAWMKLSTNNYNNLIYDCLKIREELHLCDWAYLMMLQEMSNAVCGVDSNEATLLMAYVYCQSGYKMKLAQAVGHLYMLYATNHVIYDKGYFVIENNRYYQLGDKVSKLHICEASFPEEKFMSLQIQNVQQLVWSGTQPRELKSKRYPDMQVNVSCNKNLIDFYDTYPSSELDNNFMTRWAMYANTPFEENIKNELYTELGLLLDGLSQVDAVERLLNWVQTAFVYEYDDEVWGGDRAFFPEETLYYPYADCEDRSILFTRLVRDLLGLDCILVYYPGHLATAVRFTEPIGGDYILLDEEKYTVCDPTYIGACVGLSMPGLDETGIKVILLK